MNRLTTPRPSTVADAGRTILEAVVALALIAIAVVSWGQISVTSARTEVAVAHREVALEVAANSLESLHLRSWDAAAIDPTSPGYVRRFDGNRTARAADGVAAKEIVTTDARDYTLTIHITESGDDSWRNAIVIVEWDEGERTVEVRLDSALRRPDPGEST